MSDEDPSVKTVSKNKYIDIWNAMVYDVSIMETAKLTPTETRGRISKSGWSEFQRDPNNRRKLMPGVRRKSWTAKEMNERHHEVARMVVLGYKNVEIAKTLNITKEFVCQIRNAPPVQEQLAILAGARDAQTVDVARQIQVILPKCVEYLSKTIEDPEISDALKSRNAFGLLSTGGHGPAKNINVKGVHAVLTADDIREIRDDAQNLAAEIGLLDAEAA